MLVDYLSGRTPGLDIEQIVIGYREALRIDLLEQAWQLVVQRHPALRTSFAWGQTEHVVQQVQDHLPIRIEVYEESHDERRFQEFLVRDRLRGFDLAQAPLMRLSLFDYGQQRYRLVWTVHHILLDGRGFILVLRDVEECYQKLCRGEKIAAGLGPAYRTYIDWLQKLDSDGAEEFWENRLQGIEGPTPLPHDPQARGGEFSGYGEEELRLSRAITQALRDVAERHNITLNTIVMGVWALVLSQYSGEQDVLFGAVKTTRRGTIAGADEVVGLFLNTLPVRAKISPLFTIAEVLKELRAEWLSLRRYEHTALTKIKQASTFPPSAPLFHSIVVFENQSFHTALRATDECWRNREWHLLEQPNFPLSFAVYGDPEMLLKLEFDRRKYSHEAAQRVLRQAAQLLENIAANPERKVAELSLLTAAERRQLLEDWNRTEREYPRGTPLARLIEEQVERSPDAVAVVYGEQTVTYGELNARANQLARELRRHGAGPDGLVALCVERSADMIVALLAVVKAGAAYLPLDPLLPAERLGYMLEDSGAGVLLTEKGLQGELPAFAGKTVLLGDTGWQANRNDNLGVAVRPEDLAYVIYTSGSTGKPKGVQVPRGALTNLLYSMREWLGLSEGDRLLGVTTISFDIAGVDVWLPLLVGAQAVVVSREQAADGAQLRKLLERHDITFLQATPVTWRLLLEAGWGGKANLQAVCTGEAMPQDVAERLVPVVKRVWNLYGPTETTIWSTGYEVTDGGQPILIGRPVANTQCYILDAQRQPVPIGVTGELYIAGDGVARGYLNRPELTSERFVRDPFRGGTARMYRTGDLARYHADGNIECLGRIDYQVKIRGYRIELGEIETALKQQPEIKQAVVMAREDTPGDKRLVAYLVAAEGMTPVISELRGRLKQRLPDYMMPSAYVVLDTIPISPNGKIDRKALPAPEGATHATLGYEEPQGETEIRLAAIWAEVLQVEKVGRNDDFFDLGGHSLSAVRALSLTNAAFGTNLPVRVLFQAQTVRQLAAVVAKMTSGELGGGDWSTLIPLQPKGTRPALFCVARPNVNALGYLALARELGQDQPSWGLQAILAEDPQVDFTEEQYRTTAAEYIRAIRTVQPRGPYNIIGQCQGAYISFEMVRQLERVGEQVAFFGVLDTWPEENTRRRFLYYTDVMMNQLARVNLRILFRLFGEAAAKLSRKPADNSVSTDKAPTRSSGKSMKELYWPGRDFVPPVCSAPITVFRLDKQFWYRVKDEKLGWGNRSTSAVMARRIPGEHMTFMRTPHVRELAILLGESLNGSATMCQSP
jgi:amino acid adenylation domain-containing protein